MSVRRLPSRLQVAIDEVLAGESNKRPRAPRMELVVPFPPSLNNLYATIMLMNQTPRRVLSKRGRLYHAAVAERVKLWKLQTDRRPPAPPYSLTLRVYLPDRRRHDLSNMPKVIEDALFAAIGEDDNDVTELHGTKVGLDRANPRVEVTLEGVGS